MLLQAVAQGGQAGFNPLTLALPVLVLVFFWFVLIRPQRRRQQEAQRMQSELQPGQEVMTAAGLYGTIQSIEDDVIVLETSPGVTQRYARRAVVQVVTPADPTTDSSAESSDSTTDESSAEPTDRADKDR